MRYVAEALLRPLLEEQPGDGGLALTAAACTLLEDTYSQAVERLTRGGGLCSADSSHDAEGTRNTGEEEEEGEEGAAGGGLFGAQRRSAGAGLLEARGTAGAGRQQQAQERRRLSAVAQECVQEVAGSLDEVVGLQAIKQASSFLPPPCCGCLQPAGLASPLHRPLIPAHAPGLLSRTHSAQLRPGLDLPAGAAGGGAAADALPAALHRHPPPAVQPAFPRRTRHRWAAAHY